MNEVLEAIESVARAYERRAVGHTTPRGPTTPAPGSTASEWRDAPRVVYAGAGQAQRVEGEIKNLDASGKTFEIGNVKLEWDASSAILVDCQTAAATDLRDGATVKAAYQVRDGKNVLTILEAEK